MSNDLKKYIDIIEKNEKEIAELQAKIDRLQELIEKNRKRLLKTKKR
ncbi:MAG: hypothetical protein ACTSPW_21815 [Promethearchaeota archaeon]